MTERTRTEVSSTPENKIIPIVSVILDKAGHFPLLEKEKNGEKYYSLPSGHIEEGETAVDAAVRELREELGVEVDPGNLQFVHLSDLMGIEDQRIIVTLRAFDWSGEFANMEPQKHLSFGIFSFDDLPENTRPYIRKILQNVRERISYEVFR